MGQALFNRIDKDAVRAPFVGARGCNKGEGREEGGDEGRRIIDKSPCCSDGTRTFLILVFLVAFLFNSASGLSCVQCISMNDSGCSKGGGTPKQCSGPHSNSTYCLKSVGTAVSGKGHFVMRSCSDAPISNCTRKHEYGDMYTVCHYPCAESGCNSGSGLRVSLPLLNTMSRDLLSHAILLFLWTCSLWILSEIVLQKREHPLISL